MILALDHIQLAMPAGGEDAARGFYEVLLGVPEVPKPATLVARGGCWFERGVLKLHLGADPAFVPARKAHPGFLVDDLETMVSMLKAAGHAITREGGSAYLHDPFGNRIELISG